LNSNLYCFITHVHLLKVQICHLTVVTSLQAGQLGNWDLIHSGCREICFWHSVQISSWAHPPFYSVDTICCFDRG